MGLQKGAGNQHLRPGIEYHTSKMADHSRDTISATEQHLTPLCSVCRLLSQKKNHSNCYRRFSPLLLSCHASTGHPSPQPNWNLVSFYFLLYSFSYPQAYLFVKFSASFCSPCSLSSSYPLLQPFAYLPVQYFDQFYFLTSSLPFFPAPPPPFSPLLFRRLFFALFFPPKNFAFSLAQPFHYANSQLSNRLLSGLLFVSRFFLPSSQLLSDLLHWNKEYAGTLQRPNRSLSEFG